MSANITEEGGYFVLFSIDTVAEVTYTVCTRRRSEDEWPNIAQKGLLDVISAGRL